MALTDKLTAIADAIRGKTGKTDGLTLDQMATEIAGIQGGGGGFTPQTGSFVPTEAQGGVNITLNENIPDNFAVILLLHDKNVESFINAGAVMLTVIHYNGEFIRACFASSTSALIAANRSGMSYGAGTTGLITYDPDTRVLYLTVATSSNFYLQQYDYCIVPYDGLNMAGWFA